ncbi:MAG: hypothetical protein JW892_12610, partial [Anaerolineae bacterium]|nr:hypothetical protein [Anaerolineae bacterium]
IRTGVDTAINPHSASCRVRRSPLNCYECPSACAIVTFSKRGYTASGMWRRQHHCATGHFQDLQEAKWKLK